MKRMLGLGISVIATTSFAMAQNSEDGRKAINDETGEPASLFQEGVTVTVDPGNGITFAGADESYSLNLKNYIQPKWRFVDNDGSKDTNGFSVRRARTWLSGHIWSKRITYELQLEWSRSDATIPTSGPRRAIRDAWVGYEFVSGEETALTAKLGQMKTRSSRQFDTDEDKLEFVERSSVTNTFSNARSTGLMVVGEHMQDEKLQWNAGIFNGDVAATSQRGVNEGATNIGQNEPNYVLGVKFDPSGHMDLDEGDLDGSQKFLHSYGVNAYFGNEDAVTNGAGTLNWETTQVNVQAAMKYNGIAATAEFFWREDDQEGGSAEQESRGWYVQGSYTTPASESGSVQYGMGGRVSVIDFNRTDTAGAVATGGWLMPTTVPIEGGTNTLAVPGQLIDLQLGFTAYYHKHALKSQLMYTYQQIGFDGVSPGTYNHGLEVMLTLAF